jgi:hypothetical protein
MDDKIWYYNYFKKFVDTPAVRSESSPAFSEIPLPREKEGEALSRAPETVAVEPAGVSDSVASEVQTPVKDREKVSFGKAPPALLAAIKRPGKAKPPTSLDLTAAGAGRKRNIDKVDGPEPAKRVQRKTRLTDVYPGLAKLK